MLALRVYVLNSPTIIFDVLIHNYLLVLILCDFSYSIARTLATINCGNSFT